MDRPVGAKTATESRTAETTRIGTIVDDPPTPIPTWPLPWTVATVQQRFARRKRRGHDPSRSTLSRAEATAILRDAVNQGQAESRTDLGVIDDSLSMYLTYRDTPLE